MRAIIPFGIFENTVNEGTAFSSIRYSKDDVETAFHSLEDELGDYYYIDKSNTEISLEWSMKKGPLEVVPSADNVGFDFDHAVFSKNLIRNLSHNPDSTGPGFTKTEIEKAIAQTHYKAVFQENVKVNSDNFNIEILVNENWNSTELTITGKIDGDSVNINASNVNTDIILETIIEQLYLGVANRIYYT